MELFQQYIAPLTHWLHDHPQAGLFITFLISFAESLAIIGSIIPGSVTMTAIGILAGSGVMRIDLTFLAASLGAIAGDGASYLLGFYFRDRLSNLWPFSRYPNILAYGQLYFEKHGGKSVIIGRFVGPLRSIIPVIAGMMHMAKIRFFIANVLSGIVWSVLYITPGILIGAASHELSPERATQFVLLILILLLSVWLLSLGIKALYLRSRTWLDRNLHLLWSKLLVYSPTRKLCSLVTPILETHHTHTALLLIFLCLSLTLLLIFSKLHLHSQALFLINHPTHLFLQSIRTHYFDLFFAISQQLMSPLCIVSVFLFMVFYHSIHHDLKGLTLWLTMAIISITVISIYHPFLHTDLFNKPPGILENIIDFSYPFTDLSLGTALFIALLNHNSLAPHSFSRLFFTFLLLLSLFFGSLSFVYLGDLWFTDYLAAFCLGLCMGLVYWIIYRKLHPVLRSSPLYFSRVGLLVLFLSAGIGNYYYLNQSLQNHQIYFTQHILSEDYWWKQEKPLLPVYSRNRVGKIISVFNIQYVGRLDEIRRTLEHAGWRKQKNSLFHLVLKKVEGQAPVENPLLGSVYLHRKPTLTMVYFPHHAAYVLRLQLWRSNYYIHSFEQPVWLGHVQLVNRSLNRPVYAQDPALFPLKQALHPFQTKLVQLSSSGPRPNSLIKANYVLLIKPF